MRTNTKNIYDFIGATPVIVTEKKGFRYIVAVEDSDIKGYVKATDCKGFTKEYPENDFYVIVKTAHGYDKALQIIK